MTWDVLARNHRLARPALVVLTALLLGLCVALTGPGAVPARATGGDGQPVDRFTIATFNMLGADHTDGRHGRPGFDNSTLRLGRALKVLRHTHVDVVGFQEFQDTQYAEFLRRVGDRWSVFTGGSWDTDNSIAWRSDRFELVESWTVDVPYFHGNLRPMPVVGLRSLATGREFFVMNTHNPADVRGNASQWRAEAVRIERAVTRKLSNQRHAPVFMTGDMNDRAEFFCPFTRSGVMHSVFGGSHPKDGACQAPRSGVDWILGNRWVRFGAARVDRSPLVQATTDHPVVSAPVELLPGPATLPPPVPTAPAPNVPTPSPSADD